MAFIPLLALAGCVGYTRRKFCFWIKPLLALDSPYFDIRKYRTLFFTASALLILLFAKYALSYRPQVNLQDLIYESAEATHEERGAPSQPPNKGTYLEAFGSPDSNLFYLEGIDFLSTEGINLLYELEQDILHKIPYLREIFSVINLFPPHVKLPLQKMNAQQNQQWLKRRIFDSPKIARSLISPDGYKTLVVLDFEALPAESTPKPRYSKRFSTKSSESPYIQIGRAMEQIRERYEQSLSPGLKIWPSGAAHIVYQQYTFYIEDLSKIFILLLLIMALLIFCMLRSWLAFFGTALSAFFSNWLTIGAMSMLNLQVDLTFFMIPITISVATAIGYSVHFYNHFRHSLQHTSVDIALAISWLRCFQPITFTAITTMFSFLSLHLVPIPAIQNTGYTCLLSILVIYIFTMTLFPLILSFTRFRGKYRNVLQHSKWALSSQLEILARISFRFRKWIIVFSCILLGVSLFYASRLRANYQFSEFMGSENQIVKEIQYLEQSEFAPVGTVSIIIHNPNGLFLQTAPSILLQDWQQIIAEIETEDIVKQAFWLGNLIEDAAQLRQQKQGLASIRSIAELNGLLLLSRRLSRFNAYSWLSTDQKSLRILVKIQSFQSRPLIDLVQKYQQRFKTASPAGTQISFTGFLIDTSRGDLLMTKSFIKSIVVSLLIIFFLLLLIFRRLYITLISLIPNVFPIILIGGFISFMEIDLNSFNFLMFPMVIGLIVDDTIHFFYTLVKRFDSSKNYHASIHTTLVQVGPALVETTIILCSSFAVFAFSKFQGLANMGLFTVLVIFIALVSDLILGPICLSMLSSEHLQYKPLRRGIFLRPHKAKKK